MEFHFAELGIFLMAGPEVSIVPLVCHPLEGLFTMGRHVPARGVSTMLEQCKVLERHLVLEGPAGSGKTLVALHLAKSILRSLSTPEDPKQGPMLVATTGVFEIKGRHPLLHIIDSFTTEVHENKKIITDRKRLWERFGVW